MSLSKFEDALGLYRGGKMSDLPQFKMALEALLYEENADVDMERAEDEKAPYENLCALVLRGEEASGRDHVEKIKEEVALADPVLTDSVDTSALRASTLVHPNEMRAEVSKRITHAQRSCALTWEDVLSHPPSSDEASVTANVDSSGSDNDTVQPCESGGTIEKARGGLDMRPTGVSWAQYLFGAPKDTCDDGNDA
ncbi:hypothetical protein, variant [Saprolegnia diclina VS20]|uniref:Uncharacterized protein n=1 Tax=Saprolegnia diclina (strain VS20) TaxID=1156394 RepID=T0R751_SAPDV|nr:hypothetical protein SDRG_16817 [Saprolegnia diclina VS20]XP_008621260.1 hypothetical protein, variant [Saprolegnia diclina VS20]EQC25321.1 hypothetical protein SDRG_16817 [Saprolegnia diclina VS20]EQC25322.1 hypothetical protein, variant [Saprolegnia diclina VS20]|eukprot:XP_008621259.1 hypothetical protein SDRG_16817 [Saprolegnia diclina VS20]